MKKLKKALLIVCGILVALFMLLIIIPTPDSGTKETAPKKEDETSVVVEEPTEESENVEPIATVKSETQEDVQDTSEDSEWLYNIIPYSTYESGGDDLHLYANIVWNEDDSIELYGFGYSYGEVVKDYEVSVHLTPDPEYANTYISDFRNFYVGFVSDYIAVYSDGDEAGHSFSGDFSLVIGDGDEFTGDYVELSIEEVPDFFRDTTNVGSTFRCDLLYSNFASYLGEDYHYLYYNDGRTYISFVIYANSDDPRFFKGDRVTVTGVYTDQYDANADIVIDAISMKLSD